jgi:hypothetical protein
LQLLLDSFIGCKRRTLHHPKHRQQQHRANKYDDQYPNLIQSTTSNALLHDHPHGLSYYYYDEYIMIIIR